MTNRQTFRTGGRNSEIERVTNRQTFRTGGRGRIERSARHNQK